MFENHLHNYQFKVFKANNRVYKFIITDYPLMNLNDLITLPYLSKTLDDKKVTDKRSCILGYSYVKNSIDCYIAHLGLSNFDIAIASNKPEKNPK